MINKITVYSREVRDYYGGEDVTQYMLAPESAEKRGYMNTDCLAVSMDDTEPVGEFRLRKGVSGRVRGEGTGAFLDVGGEYFTMRDILKGAARRYGRLVWF